MNNAFATRSRPALFASLLAATMLLAPAASAQSFSDDQKQAIEGIIKDYLLKHPEVLQDAMNALEKKQQEADAEKARTTIKDNNATLFNSRIKWCSAIRRATSPWSNSSITIAATASGRCPTC